MRCAIRIWHTLTLISISLDTKKKIEGKSSIEENELVAVMQISENAAFGHRRRRMFISHCYNVCM